MGDTHASYSLYHCAGAWEQSGAHSTALSTGVNSQCTPRCQNDTLETSHEAVISHTPAKDTPSYSLYHCAGAWEQSGAHSTALSTGVNSQCTPRCQNDTLETSHEAVISHTPAKDTPSYSLYHCAGAWEQSGAHSTALSTGVNSQCTPRCQNDTLETSHEAVISHTPAKDTPSYSLYHSHEAVISHTPAGHTACTNQVLILQRCQPVSTHSVHHAVKMTHLKRRTKLSFRIPLQRTHRHTACTTVRVHGNNQVLILQRCQPVSTHSVHHAVKMTHLKRRTKLSFRIPLQRTHRHTACTTVRVHGNNQVLILQRCQPVSTHSVHHAVKMTHLKRRTKLSFRIPLQRTHRHTACTTVRVHGNQVLILQRCQPVSTHSVHHAVKMTHLKRRTKLSFRIPLQRTHRHTACTTVRVHGNNQVLILQRCQPVSTHSVHHAVKMTHLKRRTKLSFRIPLQRTHRHTACKWEQHTAVITACVHT